MKSIPNIISVLRILLSVIIFFSNPFGSLLWALYLLCGISDVLDGYIARRFNLTSKTGEVLDSIADIAFMSVVVIILLPLIKLPKSIVIWIIFIAILRVLSIILVYIKYHVFAILHTHFNKLTGVILFLVPVLYNHIEIYILGIAACTIATIAVIEELIINITSKQLDRNIKGLLTVKWGDE